MPQQYQRLLDHAEPAHYRAVKIYDYLRQLYRFVRETWQTKIDETFDNVSKEIGFVVTTTLPMQLELGKNGAIKGLSIGAEQLKGTIFEREFTAILQPKAGQISGIPEGTYNLYFIWVDALKLKLKTDWMEPAHPYVVKPEISAAYAYRIPLRMEVMEPAHWFNPVIPIEREEAIQISIIDEVFPELKLADRVTAAREASRKTIYSELRTILPDVREPAHFQKLEEIISPEKLPQFLDELTTVLRRYGYKF